MDFEALKSSAIELSINGVFFSNSDFELTYVNGAFLDLMGYDKQEEVIGKPIDEVCICSDVLSEIKKGLQESEKWRGQLSVESLDGSDIEIMLAVQALKNEVGERLVWKGTLVDISGAQQIEKVHDRGENRFQRLLESSPDAILIIGDNGDIKLCNDRVEEIMGYRKEELLGQPVEKLIPNSKRQEHVGYREAYNKNPYKRSMGSGLDLFARRKDGTKFPVDIKLGPLEENGQLHIMAIIRDVSDYKESQKTLKREKEFTALLHEISKLANESRAIDEILRQSIRRICQYMEWPVGHVYLPANDNSGEFYPTAIWHLEDEENFDSFKKITMCTRFYPGLGMVGEVMESGKPCWYKNAYRDPRFVRKMFDTDLNIRACFGLPILVENRVEGVLEFFSNEVKSGDAVLLEKMATVGKQLGQAIERLKAKELLKQNRTKFKTLFDSARDAILILDKNSLIDCNKSAVRLFDSSYQELKKSSLASFLPDKQPDGGDSKRIALQKIKQSLAGQDQFFEFQFERPDGTIFDAEVNLIHIKLNRRSHVQVIVQDITQRKESERLLKKNMTLFSQLFENSPGSVVLLDKSKKVIKINDSFAEIFGYELEDLKNEEITEVIVPDDQKEKAQEVIGRTFDGESIRFEGVRKHKNGREIPVVIDTAPVKIQGETVAVFNIYVDISERIEIEEKMRKSLDEKEILLNEIHHRVKNNLAVVSGLLELQVTRTEDEGVVEKLKESQSRIHSMALIHDQLYQMNSFSALDLAEYIQQLAESIRSTFDDGVTDIEIVFQTNPSSTLTFTLDRAIPCGQILNELLTNAFKHAFNDQEEGVITIVLLENEGEVKLKVSDNGSGITDKMMDEDSDTLGLTLVRTLVQQLEGTLEINNREGTTFTICFPAAD